MAVSTQPPSWRLRVWTRFLAPPEQVWAFKTDPDRLAQELWPLVLRFDDRAALVAALQQGLPGRFPARLYPPGLRWVTELAQVEPGQRFVDRSQNLLYRDFEHRHVVQPVTDGTRYVDDVTFTPAGPWPELIVHLTRLSFQSRHRRAARHLPHDPRATGVVVLRQVLEHERTGGPTEPPPESP